jgi:glycosyltransferase involved in cell wall biosynthesis
MPSTAPPEQTPDTPRIVLDGVFFQLYSTGIARLWRALMAEWSASGFAEHVVVLDRCRTAPRLPGFTYRDMTPFRFHESLLQRIALQSICEAESADLFVSTYYTSPTTTPSLLCVYDMIPEVLGFDPKRRLWREKRRAIEHASAFVAISESTARDLHRFYPATASLPLAVAHCAADPVFTPAAEAEVVRLLEEIGLPREYVLFIGARDVAYKNASLVFEALASLPRDSRPALLLVGGSVALEAEFEAKTCGTVVRIARLSDRQLSIAYSGALGLLYPSRYEGFGIPVLEAMACGCPVVTCRNSSIPEAAGDAAIYVAEDDPEGLAHAIRLLRSDDAVRDACRTKGRAWAKRFSWKATAAEVESFVRAASGGSPKSG